MLEGVKYGEGGTFMLNIPDSKEIVSDAQGDDIFFCYADFIRPGKHRYLISREAESNIEIMEP